MIAQFRSYSPPWAWKGDERTNNVEICVAKQIYHKHTSSKYCLQGWCFKSAQVIWHQNTRIYSILLEVQRVETVVTSLISQSVNQEEKNSCCTENFPKYIWGFLSTRLRGQNENSGNEADRFNNTAVSAVNGNYLKTLLNWNIFLNVLNVIKMYQ